MEAVKLTTLYELLDNGCTAAQLATTIERSGVHGWDRFGRFGQYSASSNAGAQALDALAAFYAEEEAFWQGLQDNPPEGAEDIGSRVRPIDAVADFPKQELHKFGWPPEKVPEIDRLERHPRMPRVVRDPIQAKKLLETIGALLYFLKTRSRPYSQSEVINDISSQHPEVPGLQKATLEQRFADGNAALTNAKNSTPI
jgi:hypothetical protein